MGVIRNRRNMDLSLVDFTDVSVTDIGSGAVVISELKDCIPGNQGFDTFTEEDLLIYTGTGATGTKLVQGTHFEISVEDTDLTSRVTTVVESAKTIYRKIQVTDATYQTGTIYFTGKTCGDYHKVDDLHNITWTYTSKTANWTITDLPGFILYPVTTGTNKVTATLPTVAANDNQEFQFMKIDSGYAPLVIEGEGAETINGWDRIVLFGQYEKVRIKAIDGEWVIIDNWKWHLESGWVANSDWTNRHLGIYINYDNLSTVFEQWEVITATSGNRGIIIYDDGASGMYVVYIDDGAGGVGGEFLNNEQITGGSSGCTADVNEISGSTKNQDSNIYHGFGISTINIKGFTFSVSTDGTEGNIITSYGRASYREAGDRGHNIIGVDTDQFIFQTGSAGDAYLNGAGTFVSLGADDDYYYNFSIDL